MRVQIWIALLEIVSLFLVVPHLSGETHLARMRSFFGGASSRLTEIWRAELETAALGRWLVIGGFMVAVSWLILAIQLRLRWYLIAPAMIIVAVPPALLVGRHLSGIAAERRYACFVGGAGCFLAAKLIVVASALSRG